MRIIEAEAELPIIIMPDQMKTYGQGDGWQVVTLADKNATGEPATVARRWSFCPGACGPDVVHHDADQLLYVIHGTGEAEVNGERFPLEQESVLWLEPGDSYRFSAGSKGLEILQGYAPG